MGLGDLTAFRDHDWMATAEWKNREIKQRQCEFSQSYAEFHVITTDLDWNSSDLWNALRMGLSKEFNNSLQYSDKQKELCAFVALCQKRNKLVWQC